VVGITAFLRINTLFRKTARVSLPEKKMKKFLAILTLGFVLLPTLVLGAVGYERTPSGYTISNPVSFAITGVFEEHPTALSWKIYTSGAEVFWSDCVSTTSETIVTDLNLGEYTAITLIWYEYESCSAGGFPDTLEYNAGEPIFEVVEEEPPVTPFIEIGTDFVGNILAYIGDLVTGIGPLLYFVIGAPLAFWAVRKVIGLTPKR
jgi:hypothetical protein